MGATFNRVKTWVAEKLLVADINAEFDNILSNLTPAGVDDASANTAAMQVQTDPGEVGTESLATSIGGELERLRFEIAEIKGTTYHYTTAATDLAAINTSLTYLGSGTGGITSGATSANSAQSMLLVPEGAGVGNNCVIKASTTDLVYSINNVTYTATSDVTITSFTTPPIANNTALINNPGLNDQFWTKWDGIGGGGLFIDNVGPEISSKEFFTSAFKIVNSGAEVEYFLGRNLDVTIDIITDLKRGWFFDENSAPVEPIVFGDTDVVTLMNLAYIFFSSTQTATVTYNEPIYKGTAPTVGIATGDFWFDIPNSKWMKFNGSTWDDSLSVLIGTAVIDENGDCVAARSEDFTHVPSAVNEVALMQSYGLTSKVYSKSNPSVAVMGKLIDFGPRQFVWDMSIDLESGVTEAASTVYHLYIKDTGDVVISDKPPQYFDGRLGWYHTYETWRCIGQAFNAADSNLISPLAYINDGATQHAAHYIKAAGALTFIYLSVPVKRHTMGQYNATAANAYGDAYPTGTVAFPFYQTITVPSTATLSHLAALEDNVVLHVITGANSLCGITLGVSAHQWGQTGAPAAAATLLELTTGSDGPYLYSPTLYSTDTGAGCYAKAVAVHRCISATAGTWAHGGTDIATLTVGDNLDVCRRIQTATLTASDATNAKVDVADLSARFAATGRNVRIGLEPDGSGANIAYLDVTKVAASVAQGYFYLQNTNAAGSPSLVRSYHMYQGGAVGTLRLRIPCSVLSSTFKYSTAALPLYFCLQSVSTTTAAVAYTVLYAEELPLGVPS